MATSPSRLSFAGQTPSLGQRSNLAAQPARRYQWGICTTSALLGSSPTPATISTLLNPQLISPRCSHTEKRSRSVTASVPQCRSSAQSAKPGTTSMLGCVSVLLYSECVRDCVSCSSAAWQCSLCQVGLLKQPFSSDLCFSACPSGYSDSGGQCVGSDQVVADFKLEGLMATISGGNGRTAINGATAGYFPPYFETTDPIPSVRRGYYFKGGQYVQLPPSLLATGNPILLSVHLTLSAWIRPQSSGRRTIYSKKGSTHIFTVRLASSNAVEFEGGYPPHQYTHTYSLPSDVWTYLALTFSYNKVTGMTTITYYFDGVAHPSSYSNSFYIKDVSLSAGQTIGASPDLTDFYQGFIWRVTIRNYIAASISTEITSLRCPSDASNCLSPCEFDQTWDCGQCASSCDNGCIRTSDCSLCADPLCNMCLGSQGEVCVQCKENASKNTSALCACNSSYFADLLASACVACHPTCLDCVSDSLSSCTACRVSLTIRGSFPGECICGSSYYFSLELLKCSPCSPSCQDCVTQAQCVTCKNNAELQHESCECTLGFYGKPDARECVPCGNHCESCSDVGCVQCYPGFYLFSRECYTECPSGYRNVLNYTCDTQAALTCNMTASATNSLILTFSEPMNCSIPSNDLSISVLNAEEQSISVTWSDARFTDPQSAEVTLQFEDSDVDSRCRADLRFLNPDAVRDAYGRPVDEAVLTTYLKPLEPASPNPLRSSPIAIQTLTATQSTLAVLTSVSILTGNPFSIIQAINQFQLITYISMSALTLPRDFASVLSALNAGFVLPNPLIDMLLVSEKSQISAPRVADFGIATSVAVANAVTVGGGSLVVLATVVPIWLLSKVRWRRGAECGKRMLESFRWTVPLNVAIVLYLDFGILSLLQVQHASFATAYLAFSSIFACAMLAVFVAAPVLLFLFLHFNSAAIASRRDSAFLSRWKVFTAGFCDSKAYIGVYYYFLFLVRRFALAFSLFYPAEYPAYFGLVNTLFSVTVSDIAEFGIFMVAMAVCGADRPVRSHGNRVWNGDNLLNSRTVANSAERNGAKRTENRRNRGCVGSHWHQCGYHWGKNCGVA